MLALRNVRNFGGQDELGWKCIDNMKTRDTFSEVKLFQVKPDKVEEFERFISNIAEKQRKQNGCINLKYMKRFYTLQEIGLPPRELTKIVKCVKFYSYWEFDTKENYGNATDWFFENYGKEIMKLLIMPFDINCGDTIY